MKNVSEHQIIHYKNYLARTELSSTKEYHTHMILFLATEVHIAIHMQACQYLAEILMVKKIQTNSSDVKVSNTPYMNYMNKLPKDVFSNNKGIVDIVSVEFPHFLGLGKCST